MTNQEVKKQAAEQTETPPQGLDLTQKLAEAEQQVQQYKDLLLRKAAEFENYKKRVESESAVIVKFANEQLLLEILPIVDDLERSLKLSKEKKDFESFYKGIDLIYQKTVKLLADQGVAPMETVGKEFSVDFHDALMQVPKSDVPPHTILEEVEKGYTLNNKVLRHAKVIVSTAPMAEAEPSPNPGASSDHQQHATE
ncbi:MAG: nucleotide exchange factor GrpE [Ignavibacteriae bacterium]|nr:nucleotide exchange factor GrpE [Ignavibacteriota bacterium]